MKNLALLSAFLFSLFISTNSFANKDIEVESSIEKVKVFIRGARIYRNTSFTVNKGETKVVLKGLSSYFDEKTMQVKLNGDVLLLDVRKELNYLTDVKKESKITQLEDSINEYIQNINRLNEQVALNNNLVSLMHSNQNLSTLEKGVSLTALSNYLPFYQTELTGLYLEQNKINLKINEIRRKKNVLMQRLRQLGAYNNTPDGQIVLTILSKSTTKVNAEIEFSISNAGWTPSYDIRVNALSKPVNFTFKAEVYQSSGIEWNETKLVLSTRTPSINNIVPGNRSRTFKLDAEQNADFRFNTVQTIDMMDYEAEPTLSEGNSSKISLDGKDIGYTFNSVNEVSAIQMRKERERKPNPVHSIVNATTSNYTLNKEFEIPLPYTVKTDNQKYKVGIMQIDVDANYVFNTIPKLDEEAFMIATIKNFSNKGFLPGNAKIFFQGTFVGHIHFNPNVNADSMNISMGRSGGFTIDRSILKEFNETNLRGTKREKTMAYKISIKNLDSDSANIRVKDRVPITSDSEISIEVLESSNSEEVDKYGFLLWDLNLAPGETKELIVKYKVEAPVSYHLVWASLNAENR